MDELTSMAMWFTVIIISINLGIIFLASPINTDMAAHGLTPNLQGTLNYGTDAYSIPTGTTGNTISSTETTIPQGQTNNFLSGLTQVTFFVANLLTAWAQLLYAIMLGVPGGSFFVVIFLPIIGVIQIASLFILGKWFAGVIRGVV